MTGTNKLTDSPPSEEVVRGRIGQVLAGKWTLEEVLGVGAFAAVYRAEHKIGHKVAIKILHPDIAGTGEWTERFHREARVANELGHPAVVKVEDCDVTEDGAPFLVMALIDGETLTKRLGKTGSMPAETVLSIADQILDCLAVAHAAGVIHRDIKPSNLMLEADDRARVLDFGVARFLRGERSKKPLTEPGTVLGTVAYMAPEQLRGEDIDGRADLYSVGATMFRLLSGRQVHGAGSDDAIARQILAAPAPALRSVSSDVPEGVAAVVDRALASAPADRFPDARAMQNAIRALMGLAPLEPVEAVADSAPAPDAEGPRVGPRGTLIGEDDASSGAASSEEAPTAKRADPDEATTIPRKVAKTEVAESADAPAKTQAPARTEAPAATRAPSKTQPDAADARPPAPPPVAAHAEARERGGRPYWAIVLVVAFLGLLVWRLGSSGEETDETRPTKSNKAAKRSASPADDDDDDGDDDDGERSATGRPTSPEPPPTDPDEPSGTPTSARPATTSTGGAKPSATPSSSASAAPSAGPPTLPSTLPSGFPTTLPSGFPSSLPPGLPSSIPGVFPPPPPPPPPAPPPP